MRRAALAALLSLASAVAVRADNNTHSNWTINISEGGMTPAPAVPDDLPEVTVVGLTVHVLWLANDPAGACSSCVIWYRRSRDNGKTWDPRVMIAPADRGINTAFNGNRFMAVDNNNVVHIAWPTVSPTNSFDGWLMYRRSRDGGTTWDAVKNLYDVNTWPWWPDITIISTDGVKTNIAANITSDRAAGGWIQLLTTSDGGNTFTSTNTFGQSTTDSYKLLDAKRAGDRTYVLYSDITDLYGGVAKDYLKVVPDSGSGFGPYLVSVPSKDGSHHATLWQSNNYSPKIAVSSDKAYVAFACLDANNVRRSTMRRLYNYGANLDPAIIASEDDPDGTVSSADDVSVAANGSYGMMVYHVDTGDKYGGIAKIVVKRYSESSQAAVPAISMFGKVSYFRGSGQPTINTGSGQNAFVMWQAPTLARTTDSFNTEIYPVEPQPLGTWSGMWPTQLKTTIGPDGTVHWVEVGAFKGNKGDADILYSNWTPPSAPGTANMALSLTTSDSAYRYDAMEAPAGAATTNFKSAMTMAMWVQVQPLGARPCCTDIVPIVSKQEYVQGDSYVLGTAGQAPSRYPVAAITTSVNGFRVQPSGNQGTLTEGQWYHLAFTYNSAAGANNFNLYVNGSLVGQGTATGQLATSDGPLVVGSLGSWVVDDLSLWNRALSPAEILQIKGGPLKGTESGLALYFNFDNTTMALNNPNAAGVLQYQESFVPSTWSASQSACSFVLSSISQSFGSAASTGMVNVTAGAGCAWTAISNAPTWLHVTAGATGSASGSVAYSVDANTATSPRTGTLTIAGQTFTVSQAAAPACTYVLSATSVSVGSAASGGSFNVMVAFGCPWTATPNAAWISTSSTGNGNGPVNYNVAANSDTNPRTGTIAVAGQTFTIAQAGVPPCTYALDSSSGQMPSSGGAASVNVLTAAGCTWTAASNNTDWISIPAGNSGTGLGGVTYSSPMNRSGSARTGTLTIAGQTFTVNQGVPGADSVPVITAVTNQSDGSTWLTPGSKVAITGANLSAATDTFTGPPMPLSMDGITVWIYDGSHSVAAPISHVSASEIDVLLPYGIIGPNLAVAVQTGAAMTPQFSFGISGQSPHVETDTQVDAAGNAIASHLDGTLVNAGSPASAGEVIALTVLGLGDVWPAPESGSLPGDGSTAPLSYVSGPVSATVGGYPASVISSALKGFAEYQIQFAVPLQLMPGNYPVKVSCGDAMSQDQVMLPIMSDWEAGQTASIGPQGGTVSYGGLTLTIPAGSLDNSATIGVTRHMVNGDGGKQLQYALTGLPDSGAGPMTVSIDTSGIAGTPALEVWHEGGNDLFGSALFPIVSSGGQATLTLPDTRASANGSLRRGARPRDVYQGGGCSSSPTGVCQAAIVQVEQPQPLSFSGACPDDQSRVLFTINWEESPGIPALDTSLVQALGQGLVKDCQLLRNSSVVNLPWKARSWPIQVHLFTFVPKYKDRWAMEGDTFWGKSTQGIDVNRTYLTAQNLQLMTVTAGHELFHVLQNQYDARSGPGISTDTTGGPWLWYDEAASTWLERRIAIDQQLFNGAGDQSNNYVPTTVMPNILKPEADSDNYKYILSGLGNTAGLPSNEVQDRGYGAAMFLEYLGQNSPTDIAAQFSKNDPFSAQVLPVDSLRNFYTDQGLSSKWESYCQAFVQGQLYPGFPDPWAFLGLTQSRTAYLQYQPTTNWSSQASSLSAQFFNVIFTNAKFADGQQLIVRMAADETANLKMGIFRSHQVSAGNLQMTQLSYGQPQFTIDNPQDFVSFGDALFIMVVNPSVDITQAPAPYTVSVGNGGFTKIDFRLKDAFIESNTPDVPLKWDTKASSFQASSGTVPFSFPTLDGNGSCWGSYSYSFSGQLTPAPAGTSSFDYLDNLHVHYQRQESCRPDTTSIWYYMGDDPQVYDETSSWDVVFKRLTLGNNGTYGSPLVLSAIQSFNSTDNYVSYDSMPSYTHAYGKDDVFPPGGTYPSNTISVALGWF